MMKGIFSSMVLIGGAALPLAAAENVHLYGTLVSEPCKVSAQGDKLSVEFGSVVDKYLYLNQRSPAQALEINLVDCDLSVGKSVRVTFNGIENAKLPGLLALSGSSKATGIAIGFEGEDGQLLPVNKASSPFQLQAGMNTLRIRTFVGAEPEALKNKTIGRGEFDATVTFRLDYL